MLIHGGWGRGSALLLNLLSGGTFLVGALVAYFAAKAIDVGFLVPLAAGNKHRSARSSVIHFLAFAAGIAILWVIRWLLEA